MHFSSIDNENFTHSQPTLEALETQINALPAKKRGRPRRAPNTNNITTPTNSQISTETPTKPIRKNTRKAPIINQEKTTLEKYTSDNQEVPHSIKPSPIAAQERRSVHFEYAPTPPPTEEWQPGSTNSAENYYTGLPAEHTRPNISPAAVTESFRYTTPPRKENHSNPHIKQDNTSTTPQAEHFVQRSKQRTPYNERKQSSQNNYNYQQKNHHPLSKNRPTLLSGLKSHSSIHKKDLKPHNNLSHRQKAKPSKTWPSDDGRIPQDEPMVGFLPTWEMLKTETGRLEQKSILNTGLPLFNFNQIYSLDSQSLNETVKSMGLNIERAPTRRNLLNLVFKHLHNEKQGIQITGVLEITTDGYGLLVYSEDSYSQKTFSTFISKNLIDTHALQNGHIVTVLAQSPREHETCPAGLEILKVMKKAPENILGKTPFTELTPYYPLERLLLECSSATWDNMSMRVVDILTPIGLGQRGLIVAPPRVGKTVFLQNIAHAIAINRPDTHLIVLLIDERPEEVTDFRRHVKGEVIASTFDQSPESHVHAAEMVLAKSRRMVEMGEHVIILLDSITRLARAYNTLMPTGGKILSGGVDTNALERPKRFFGSARNIEGGGSLTILGTALIDTGSKMDEVIFEEFKGTGNMELHLDRSLAEKRIFPAINFEKSGTRKEELLYHPEELQKIYALRRAMKGVPPLDAMEMLIQRIKKTKNNSEFLMSLTR